MSLLRAIADLREALKVIDNHPQPTPKPVVDLVADALEQLADLHLKMVEEERWEHALPKVS